VTTCLVVVNVAVFVLNLFVVVASARVVPGLRQFPVGLPAEVQARAEADRSVRVQRNGETGFVLVDPASRQVVGFQGEDRQVRVAQRPIEHWGHFSTAKGFFGLEVWRLITFQFLHFGWLHLGLNMLGLWLMGPDVEEFLGRKRYLAFYLVCGVFGAVAYLLLNLLGNTLGQHWRIPGLLFDDVATPLVGASAGIFGIILAAAYIAPQRIVDLFFVIPVKVRVLAYGLLGVAAVQLFIGAPNAGGEAAHIGGALAGYYFIRRSYLLRDFFEVLGDEPPDQNPGEVDRVLAKVGREGRASLTPAEQRVLDDATSRLSAAKPPAGPAS
jgi:membrane associated rhomboid family serine protease